MKHDFENIASGMLCYKNTQFTFVFDRKELRLIPCSEDSNNVERWFMKDLGRGVSTLGDSISVQEPLVGQCNEGHEIVFIPNQARPIALHYGSNGCVLLITAEAYIWKRFSHETISRLGFEGPELNGIFDTRIGIAEQTSTVDTVTIKTRKPNEASSQERHFVFEGKKITIYFGISFATSYAPEMPPLSLQSEMYFEFEPTSDPIFIWRLYLVAKKFISFLCYRQNVSFTAINAYKTIEENGKYYQYARLYDLREESQTEMACIKKKKYICQEYIDECEGRLLEDIANGRLYTRHIPHSYAVGRNIDAARFVMITAAFEWEFKRLFPNGITKRAQTLEAEEIVKEQLLSLYESANGKTRKIYKTLFDNIGFTQLSAKIVYTGKELGSIINVFGNPLYRMNNQVVDYSAIGNRLSKQRNDFAHGNLDQEFNGLSLLDLIYLEMIVYAMQLKYYGVSELFIKRAINDLFSRNLMITDDKNNNTQ